MGLSAPRALQLEYQLLLLWEERHRPPLRSKPTMSTFFVFNLSDGE